MKSLKLYLYIIISLSFGLGCSAQQRVISKASTERIVIEYEIIPDAEVEALIVPYRMQLQAEMDEIIGFSARELTKNKPESLLGNALCDLVEKYVEEELDLEVDLTLLNYGGIRRNSLPMGNISVGHIFELLPFENEVVVLTLSGQTLEELLLKIGSSGGSPMSGGAQIKLKKEGDWTSVESILIDGAPLDIEKTYKLVTIDYVANGGDQGEIID